MDDYEKEIIKRSKNMRRVTKKFTEEIDLQMDDIEKNRTIFQNASLKIKDNLRASNNLTENEFNLTFYSILFTILYTVISYFFIF